MVKSEKLDAPDPPKPEHNNVNDDRFDENERPPQLRCIDKYVRAALCCMNARYTVAFMAMMGLIITNAMRSNFYSSKLAFPDKNLYYTVREEMMMFSSFLCGYLITTIPGGILATVYPAHRIFGIAICIMAILTVTIPGAMMLGNVVVMIMLQFLLGLVEGLILPAFQGIWHFWSPPQERSRLPTIAYCGTFAGIMIGEPMSQALAQRVSWQAPLYFYAIVGVFWYLAWLWLVFEKPQMHPTITVEEKEYIEQSLGENTSTVAKSSIPFRRIVTSAPVYAIIVVNFCHFLFVYMVSSLEDTFLEMRFNYVKSSEANAISSLIITLAIPFGGILADCLRKSGKMSTTNVRKLFICGGFGVQSILIVVAALASTASGALTALNLGTAFRGLAISGYIANYLDISPKYASILMGLSSCIGTLASFLYPIGVHIIMTAGIDFTWSVMLIIPAIVIVLGIIFYGIFASGELQPWAGPRADSRTIRNPPNQDDCPTEGTAFSRL